MPAQHIILFVILISFSCFLQGIIGFGFAIIAAPFALLFLDQDSLVISMIIISLCLNFILIKRNKSRLKIKPILTILLSSFMGMPVGLWILKTASSQTLKTFVNLLSLLFVILFYFNKIKLKNNKHLNIIIGFTTGFLHTSTSMSGPPIVMYLTGKNLKKTELKKTLSFFFLVMGFVSTLFLQTANILSLEKLKLGLISVPFVVLAEILGSKMSKNITKLQFKNLVLSLLFLSSCYNLVSGFNFSFIKVQKMLVFNKQENSEFINKIAFNSSPVVLRLK
jgi:uncharacterized protein